MERETIHKMLRDMLRARAFEERVAEEYSKGSFAGFLHLYPGEEAVAVGVIHATESSDLLVRSFKKIELPSERIKISFLCSASLLLS